MKELDWFVQTLEDEFQVVADRNRISFEGNELFLDEIDESLIPSEMATGLPESLLFETMLFEDHHGTEWIGVIASHPDSREWLLQIILKESEPVLRKMIKPLE
ncbi:hypothetical protein ACEWK1_02820 [Metabacillus sp. YM-086]|uniref:hypothetical protein n=1 Tax=Metabacillus sp. YM-086 TaxID=3341729 RepID=UPI003A83D4C2